MGHAKMFNFVGQQHNQLILTDKEILTLSKENRDFFICSAIAKFLTLIRQCLLAITMLNKISLIF